MENHKENKDGLPYLLLIAIAGIGFNLYYKYDRYYLGEPLVTKEVVVEEKPAYIKAGKGGTDRYTFKGTQYLCRFWLSHGALTAIKDDDIIEKEINSVNIGDTVEVKIRQSDEVKLQDWEARPRVIEFKKGDKIIISINQIQEKDQKWYYINFGVPILCLLIWIILMARRLIKKGNEPV